MLLLRGLCQETTNGEKNKRIYLEGMGQITDLQVKLPTRALLIKDGKEAAEKQEQDSLLSL